MGQKDNWTMDYVDSVLVVDSQYNIIHTLRFNPRFEEKFDENIYSDYLNRNLFEVYPTLIRSESSIVECIHSRKIVIKENQVFVDMYGNVYNTKNLTIPIIKKGKVVGAIELSKDITSIDDDIQSKLKIKSGAETSMEMNNTFEKITFDEIITSNKDMDKNIERAKIYATSESPVLIYGETGTGKEMFVQAMVYHSDRKNEKFVAQNCAAIPESLFESLLFGTEVGAYTGAKKTKGLFEIAHGGTLFLDEINSIPLNLQAKLLRVLQDRKIRAVGSVTEKKVDVKIIAAMNMDPMEAIKMKVLREDLFYRLSSGTLRLLPLRERIEDIPIYIHEFINLFNNMYKKNVMGISHELMKLFMNYQWKGNVRELKHIIEAMVSIADYKTLEIAHLPIYMKNSLKDIDEKNEIQKQEFTSFASLNDTVKKVETDIIIKALVHARGNLTKAGELLIIPRQTLKYKINQYNIDLRKYR